MPEINRGTIEETFYVAGEYGLEQVQFNLKSLFGEEMPPRILENILKKAAEAARENNIEIVGIHGTFNMITSDPAEMSESIRRFELVAQAAGIIGTRLITLCTGTKSDVSMWSWHPETVSQRSWDEFIGTMTKVLTIAERYDMLLGIETEYTNVINTAARARTLIDLMQSDRIKIIMDCANLFHPGDAKKENVRKVIGGAFDLLGEHIVIAHGKDIRESDRIEFTYAGQGIIDFEYFIQRLEACGYKGGMILHGTHSEAEMAAAISFLKKIFKKTNYI